MGAVAGHPHGGRLARLWLLVRIPLKPKANPQQAIQRIDRATQRLTGFRRPRRIVLTLEAGVLLFLVFLRLTGHLSALRPVH